MDVTLTSHQQDAVDWLVTQLAAGQPLVALTGNAGTGKSTLIAPLRRALLARNIASVVGTPTHRAAAMLRSKGVLDATTVHEHALLPYFTADYQRALAWLGGAMPSWFHVPGDPRDVAREDIDGLPWLVYEHVKPDLAKGWNLQRTGSGKKPRRLLATIGIDGRHYFAGSMPKLGEGVLIVDEASMVGQDLLAKCQCAFAQVCLIGDPDQLPPVHDTAVLADVDGVRLTEIHRQAADSLILTLAYQVRDGVAIWKQPLPQTDEVGHVRAVQAQVFRDAPLIVFRNAAREACTHKIREALGYRKDQLYPGEPLLCRATSEDFRAMGFYNNGLFWLEDVSPTHPREVLVRDEDGELHPIMIHVEELDGGRPPYEAVPFRLAYCLTAHTAQGGEWPLVYVSHVELRRKEANVFRYGNERKELHQWAYTAITRAKDRLVFLTHHTFERTGMPTKPMSPPSTPMMTATPDEEQPLLTSPVPQLNDDIQDPAVPATLQATLQDDAAKPPPTLPDKFGEHEALLQGFCQHLQHRLETNFNTYAKQLMRELDDVCQFIHRQLEIQKDKTQQAEAWLDTLTTKAVQDGIQLRHDPYTASVQAISPQGFPLTITVAKQSAGELVEAIPALTIWLAEHQFTSPVEATF